MQTHQGGQIGKILSQFPQNWENGKVLAFGKFGLAFLEKLGKCWENGTMPGKVTISWPFLAFSWPFLEFEDLNWLRLGKKLAFLKAKNFLIKP